MIKIIFSIIISLISFNVYSNNIEIKNDKKGDGIEIINHSKVKVHYIGKLETGIEFDNSFSFRNFIRIDLFKVVYLLFVELNIVKSKSQILL